MMRVRGVVRDVVLVGAAVVVGWWARGGERAVFAQRSGGDANLAFQMIGTGPDSTLVMYNAGNRMLYVYPRAGAGSSTVNCSYSFAVSLPGAALERRNCPEGESRP